MFQTLEEQLFLWQEDAVVGADLGLDNFQDLSYAQEPIRRDFKWNNSNVYSDKKREFPEFPEDNK